MTGIIAALPAEARTARELERIGWRVAVSGLGAEGARAAFQELIEAGVSRVLVWGTAGALHPDLRPGDLIAPDAIRDANGTHFPVSAAWRQQLVDGLASKHIASTGPLVSVREPVPSHEAKTGLAQQTGSVAVDMETAEVARLALAHNLPFAVLRTIVDPLEQPLPQAVLQTRPGRLLACRVAFRLAVQPGDWPALVALGRNMRSATRRLTTAAQLLAPQASQARLT